jgi:hypothetical protein
MAAMQKEYCLLRRNEPKPTPCSGRLSWHGFGMSDIGYRKGEPRLQPRRSNGGLTTVALGTLAAGTLSVAACRSFVTGQQSGVVGLCAHLLLVGFALANTRRPCARFWWPSMALLALVGLVGAGLALTPSPGELVTASGITQLGLSGTYSAAQLGAVAMTALAWSTAGRRPLFARNSLLALSILAALQFLAVLPLGPGAGTGLGPLTELCFAVWLLATVARTNMVRQTHQRFPTSRGFERLPPEPWETLRLVSQYGDVLR